MLCCVTSAAVLSEILTSAASKRNRCHIVATCQGGGDAAIKKCILAPTASSWESGIIKENLIFKTLVCSRQYKYILILFENTSNSHWINIARWPWKISQSSISHFWAAISEMIPTCLQVLMPCWCFVKFWKRVKEAFVLLQLI